MTIYREGKAIELTADEMYKVYEEIRKNNIRDTIEWRLQDEEISFANYTENGFSSVDEYYNQFVDDCVEKTEDMIYYNDYSDSLAIDEAIETVSGDYTIMHDDEAEV